MSPNPKVPNLFVIGVPKAGTTSLFQWLGDHPEIGKSNENELRFLMDSEDPLCRPDGFNAEGLDGYARFYQSSRLDGHTKFLIDVSPQYYYQKTAQSVIGRIPDSRAIIVLRKPSARIYSLYNYSKSNKVALREDMGFREFIDEVRRGADSDILRDRPMLRYAIEHSKYAPYVRKWQSIIGPDRLRVCFFEELIRNQSALLRRIAGEIGINPGFYDEYSFPVKNRSFSLRHRGVHKLIQRNRKQLPKWIRRTLKPAYLYLNTHRPSQSVPEDDRHVLEQLDSEFLESELELARLLGRDAAIWSAS
jgi:hypothetical protein